MHTPQLTAASASTPRRCCSSDVGAAPASSNERHVLIVASDGLWEWVSNTTAVAIASAAASGERVGRCWGRNSRAASLARPLPSLESQPAAGASAHVSSHLPSPLVCRHACSRAESLPHQPPSASAHPASPALPAAEDAAHNLVEAAQKQWAVRYRGRNCDDITCVVAFLER